MTLTRSVTTAAAAAVASVRSLSRNGATLSTGVDEPQQRMSHTAHCFPSWRGAGWSCMDSQHNRGVEGIVRVRVIDRLSALVAHPKRLTVAIVALLVAAGAAVGSSAALTSSSTN